MLATSARRKLGTKPALLSVLLPAVAGAMFLAGCTSAGSKPANTSDRKILLAKLHASEKVSQRVEAQMVTVQQRLAASYPSGTVTVPGEIIGQNTAADESATKLRGLRAKLEKARQEQQKLRAKLRRAT